MTELAARSPAGTGATAADAIRARESSGSNALLAAQPPLWLVAAHADVCSVDARATFVERVAEGARGSALLVTCHRAEVYGIGSRRNADALAASAGEIDGELRVLAGEEVVRHTFRLAAGLESAVIGEDQVLHQVRGLRESLRGRPTDAYLSRLFEMAISVGRKARSSRSGSGRTLAARALDWLCMEGEVRRRDRVLIVGAGAMGRLLAREAARRQLSLIVASRSIERAAALAMPLGGRAAALDEAARLVSDGVVAGIAVALGGPWVELHAERPDGPRQDVARLPAAVDLSSPAAIPHWRPGDGPRLDIDGLYVWEGLAEPGDRAEYATAATPIVEEAVDAYRRWAAGRASVDALKTLRGRAERERRVQLDRLMRRLPELAERERALLEAYSEQLVAAVLHEPTAKLRDDLDGSAAEAARKLFDL